MNIFKTTVALNQILILINSKDRWGYTAGEMGEYANRCLDIGLGDFYSPDPPDSLDRIPAYNELGTLVESLPCRYVKEECDAGTVPRSLLLEVYGAIRGRLAYGQQFPRLTAIMALHSDIIRTLEEEVELEAIGNRDDDWDN